MKACGMLDDVGKKLPMIDRVVLRLEKESIPRWNKFLQGYYDYETTERRVAELSGEAVALSSRGDLTLSEDMAGRGIRMVWFCQRTCLATAFAMRSTRGSARRSESGPQSRREEPQMDTDEHGFRT